MSVISCRSVLLSVLMAEETKNSRIDKNKETMTNLNNKTRREMLTDGIII